MSIVAFASMSRTTGPALVDRLNAGVQASALRSLASRIDLPVATLVGYLGLSSRTLRNRSGRLTGDETERAFRVYRVLKRAEEVLEGKQGAREWMRSPQHALGNRTPLAMLVRDVGANEVLNILAAIENGGYL